MKRGYRRICAPPSHGAPPLRAFSLVELLLVVAIISIFSVMAIPRFANSLTLHRVDQAARRIAADLELARRHATITSRTVTFRIRETGDSGYELINIKHPDRPASPYVVSFEQDCFGAELVTHDLNSDLDLVFDIYGFPDSAAQILICIGDHQRRLDVDALTGDVSVTE